MNQWSSSIPQLHSPGVSAPRYARSAMGNPPPLLHVRVGTADLAVPRDRVRAVLKATRLCLLSRADALIFAATYLDGELMGVVDLAVRLGMASSSLNERSCVMIVDPALTADADEPMAWRARDARREPPVGLLVDTLLGLIEAPALDHADIDCNPTLPGSLVARTLRRGSVRVALLDLDRVLDPDALAGGTGVWHVAAKQPQLDQAYGPDEVGGAGPSARPVSH